MDEISADRSYLINESIQRGLFIVTGLTLKHTCIVVVFVQSHYDWYCRWNFLGSSVMTGKIQLP